MANRILTEDERRTLFAPLWEEVRSRLERLAAGDAALHFALRRKLSKELSYDERGKPMHRKLLKAQKRMEQGGCCSECRMPLPKRGAVLDRHEAMGGYTAENSRLLCPECDARTQEKRNYA